jgi:hypothetical protein
MEILDAKRNSTYIPVFDSKLPAVQGWFTFDKRAKSPEDTFRLDPGLGRCDACKKEWIAMLPSSLRARF